MGAIVGLIFIGVLVVIFWQMWAHRCDIGLHKWSKWENPQDGPNIERDYYGSNIMRHTQQRVCSRCNRHEYKRFRS